MSECRSCGAGIEWAKTAAGKRIPLDVETVTEGNINLVDGVAHVGAHGTGDRISHFVLCPQRKEWRK